MKKYYILFIIFTNLVADNNIKITDNNTTVAKNILLKPKEKDLKQKQLEKKLKEEKLKEEQLKKEQLRLKKLKEEQLRLKKLKEEKLKEEKLKKEQLRLAEIKRKKEELRQKKLQEISKIKKNIDEITKELSDNIWMKKYTNYILYKAISTELEEIKARAKKYKNWKDKKFRALSKKLFNQARIKENELSLIEEYKNSPIGNSIKPVPIAKAPEVTNPFAIIEAFSYIKTISKNRKDYLKISEDLSYIVSILTQQEKLYNVYYKLTNDKHLKPKLKEISKIKDDFISVLDTVSTTYAVYNQKIEQIILDVNVKIKNEIRKAFEIGASIIILYIITLLIKFIIKRSYKKNLNIDDESSGYYVRNKIINFIFIVLVFLIIMFAYISNVSYLVTFLGFASAGIAIALKDWFMSIFGWIVITTSGSIKVGDRIKVTKSGMEFVGDVADISLFRLAIREDVTLTSYQKNRRSGRVIFIPNNYVFTDLISNYTFDEFKTVWDGVDITITFDSNHKKAVKIAKDITNEYTKHITDLTKKKFQKIKSKYVLRNSSPEPRVYAFVEQYGIVISTWYHVVSYTTLGARSKVGIDILDAFMKEDDITIAYPTQSLNLSISDQNKLTIAKDIGIDV
jgi:small-conductance mechanosensitive channel